MPDLPTNKRRVTLTLTENRKEDRGFNNVFEAWRVDPAPIQSFLDAHAEEEHIQIQSSEELEAIRVVFPPTEVESLDFEKYDYSVFIEILEIPPVPIPQLEPSAITLDQFTCYTPEKMELSRGYIDLKHVGDEFLALILANVGLRRAVSLAPRELWLEALDQQER